MHNEIKIALDFLLSFLTHKIPKIKIESFTENLTKRLLTRFEGHWYLDKPAKGSAYRCFTIGNTKIDEVICDAAKDAGLNIKSLQSAFTSDISFWIDPNEVSYRIGEGSVKHLYNTNLNSLSPRSLPALSNMYDYNNLNTTLQNNALNDMYYGETSSQIDTNFYNLFAAASGNFVDSNMSHFFDLPNSFDTKSAPSIYDIKPDIPFSYFNNLDINNGVNGNFFDTISFSDNSICGSSNSYHQNRPLSNSPPSMFNNYLNRNLLNNITNHQVGVTFDNNQDYYNPFTTPPPSSYINGTTLSTANINHHNFNNNQHHHSTNAHHQPKFNNKSYSGNKKYGSYGKNYSSSNLNNTNNGYFSKRTSPNNNTKGSKHHFNQSSFKKGLLFNQQPNDGNNHSSRYDQMNSTNAFSNNTTTNGFFDCNIYEQQSALDFANNYFDDGMYQNLSKANGYLHNSCGGYGANAMNGIYHKESSPPVMINQANNFNDIDLVASKLQNLLVAN